jgi:uncharacterized protein (DUF1501 family)
MPSTQLTNQKFLIVMVKDGGEDSFNTLISRNPDHVATVLAARPTIAFTQPELDSTYAASKLAGTSFSLHPALQPLVAAWNAGDMAITHRVGPMATNLASLSIDELRAAASPFYTGSVMYPFGLAAHDKQAFGTVSMITRDFTDSTGTPRVRGENGFLGRLATRFTGFTGPSRLPMTIVSGHPRAHSTLLGTHMTSRPISIPHVGRRFNRNFRNARQQPFALARLDAIMAETKSEPRMEFFRQSNLIARDSVAFLQPVVEQASGNYAVDADFPGNPIHGWTATMWTFARTIERHLRQPALHNRTIFVGSRGEYDTHGKEGKLTGFLPTLHVEWANAVMSFRSAMIRLGVWNDVVVMDHSEFSRPLRENGAAGTDHGYARDAFAFGGAIRGRGRNASTGLFGQYPARLSVNQTGSNDLQNGTLAPGISLEQYWETVLRWFGADAQDIAVALPRRNEYGGAVNLLV